MIKLMSRREVEEVTGISRSMIYDKLNAESNYYDPEFPRQVKIESKGVRWRSDDIAEWVDKRTNSKKY